MSLKAKLKTWFEGDDDRMTEDRDHQLLLSAFPEESPDRLKALKEEIFLDLVIDNLKTMPNLKFHAQKDFFPFPTSEQLQKAMALLEPQRELKKKH